MVCIYCDRCGEEIKNKYYTIHTNEYDINPSYASTVGYSHVDAASYSAREDILKTLNNTKMYCKDCKDKIEAFINNK
ncbi:MAG: hypothetical protein PUC23_03585 [bacterium]|nr:hypothetical protein [bacterium]